MRIERGQHPVDRRLDHDHGLVEVGDVEGPHPVPLLLGLFEDVGDDADTLVDRSRHLVVDTLDAELGFERPGRDAIHGFAENAGDDVAAAAERAGDLECAFAQVFVETGNIVGNGLFDARRSIFERAGAILKLPDDGIHVLGHVLTEIGEAFADNRADLFGAILQRLVERLCL